MRHAELWARRTYWMAASFRRFQHGGFTMPVSTWVARFLRRPCVWCGSREPQDDCPECCPCNECAMTVYVERLPQFDPYLASLVAEAAYAPAPSGHSCEDDGLCELVHPSPEPFQPADWLPEKWATRPSQED